MLNLKRCSKFIAAILNLGYTLDRTGNFGMHVHAHVRMRTHTHSHRHTHTHTHKQRSILRFFLSHTEGKEALGGILKLRGIGMDKVTKKRREKGLDSLFFILLNIIFNSIKYEE